jgi:hypothetical protein
MSFEHLVQNPLFPVVSLLVTILSLVLAIVFFRRSRREKRPRYLLKQRTIIQNRQPLLPGLSVSFAGHEQPEITVAQITFWNAGADTIRREDIAQAKPLVIGVPAGVDVLAATVLRATEPANTFVVGTPRRSPDRTTTIPFTFDYLDRDDGAVVQLVHNGADAARLSLDGVVKGAVLRRETDPEMFLISRRRRAPRFLLPFFPRLSARAVGLLGVVMFGVAGLVLFIGPLVSGHRYGAMLAGLLCLLMSWSYYSMWVKPVVPRRLRAGIDEP